MNKSKLTRTFNIIKASIPLDFAITNTDEYGDCDTCTWNAIIEKFGHESHGIYVSKWLHGINKSAPYKETKGVYIGHDLTLKQGQNLIILLKANGYNVEPGHYNPRTKFYITEAAT